MCCLTYSTQAYAGVACEPCSYFYENVCSGRIQERGPAPWSRASASGAKLTPSAEREKKEMAQWTRCSHTHTHETARCLPHQSAGFYLDILSTRSFLRMPSAAKGLISFNHSSLQGLMTGVFELTGLQNAASSGAPLTGAPYLSLLFSLLSLSLSCSLRV